MRKEERSYGRQPIKVHRVAKMEEVQLLEEAGVDYIGFHIDDEAFFRH